MSRLSSVFSLPLLRFTMKMTLISIKIHLKGDDSIFFYLSVMEWAAYSADLNPISYRYIDSFGDSDKTGIMQWKTIFNY